MLFPFCSPHLSIKKWPHYNKLIELISNRYGDEYKILTAPGPSEINDAKEINAMVKDPHKSKEGNPKDDILAMWSKESVKADVKAKGGADMAKVQDKAEMMYAMKQINAMYKENKYLPTKDGSINDAVAQMQMAEQKTVTVRVKEFSQMVETYLARGGVKGFINAELTEGKQVLPLKEVRTFIDT